MAADPLAPLNLADEITGPWRHAVFTTFGVDLGFFEQAVLPLIPRARARVVLADHDHLLGHQSVAVRDGIVRHWNHSYLASGIRHGHAAHTKLILLTTSDRGRLFVGSGNLGVSGWTSVGELFTRYDFTPEMTDDLDAFTAARAFLDQLSEDAALDHFTNAYLNEIWQATPWLPSSQSDGGPVRHNLHQSFIDQVASEVQRVNLGPVDRLVAMAPFHDPTAATIGALIDRFDPGRTTVILQRDHTSVDPNSLADLQRSRPSVEFVTASAAMHPHTYLHAKLLLLEGERSAVCLQGSPNLSAVALRKSGTEANLEMANLLTGAKGAFDHVFASLDLTAVDDPTHLGLGIHGFTAPDPGGTGQLRLLAVRWDGDRLHLVMQADLTWDVGDTLFIRVKNELVATGVDSADVDAKGAIILKVLPEIEIEIDGKLSGATPIDVVAHGDDSDIDLNDERLLSNPVFCVHQPALRHLLDARSSHSRMRDLGRIDLADDEHLGALLEALQGTMIIDTATLVAAAPPDRHIADPDDEDAVYVAYEDIDYERLRNDPALRQYLHAGPIESTAGLQPGLEPLGIQMALRSITDAFRNAVGLAEELGTVRRFSSDWSVIDDDEPDDEESPEESEIEEDDEHIDAERQWSDEARTRRIWHNFIGRCLKGIQSHRWHEFAGPWVLFGNYDIFSHILQRLDRQRWRDIGFLLQSQVDAHRFVWGEPPEKDNPAGVGGWLRSLSPEEHRRTVDGMVERHLPERLLNDLVVATLLTGPEADVGLPEDRRLELRASWRDLERAVLTHPDWTATLADTPEIFEHAMGLARSLAPPNPEFDIAGQVHLTDQQAADTLQQMASFSRRSEVVTELAAILKLQPHDVSITDERLGPVVLDRIAHQLTVTGDTPITADDAIRAVANWRQLERAVVYRIKAGRSFLLAEEGEPAIWRGAARTDQLQEVEIPEMDPPPWDSSLRLLKTFARSERVVA